ncbi:hypothetical protein L3Q82_001348 [Scortum barcoo]|uniref:Uncharacterized protein n=1 Tax=Scortum barcoo TaxID=214431 RepID=A0ACB8W6T5_9TELE|nr:hypothetical protein L3Q82_001348 [Scortum barcoo]
MDESTSESPSLHFLSGRHVGGTKVILEVFLPPSDNVPCCWGQQLPTCTVNRVGRVLLPPPEVPDGLPEFLRGRPIVLLHGLTELLPDPKFLPPGPSWLRLGLGLPVPNCIRSPTGLHGPIGLLLQPDDILTYFWCPPPGSGNAATTGTRDLASTTSNLPRRQWRQRTWSTLTQCPQPPSESVRSFFPEVGVEDLLDRGLSQTFSKDPHNMFGSTRSVQLPPIHASGSNSPPGGDRLTSSAPLFTRVSKTYGRRSDETTTKSIIDLRPRVSWCHVHRWTPLCCSNMVFVMDKVWLAQKSNNRTPLGFRSGRPVPPNHAPPGITVFAHVSALKSPSRTMEPPVGALSSTPPRDSKKAGYSVLLFGP